jgi:Predicted amidophosphoribosyltransferases
LPAKHPSPRLPPIYITKREEGTATDYAIKYRGEKEAGFQMGKLAAAELYKEDFFEGIDLIIPVPLHPGRQRRRGYNQAECIARGIASVAQIPVDCRSLVRKRQTNTQTHKNVFERWTNVQDIFH